MPEYIEREALIATIQKDPWIGAQGKDYALSDIAEQPTADVVEVRHGEWKLLSEKQYLGGSYTTTFYCSICHREVTVCHEDWYGAEKVLTNKYPYCHCGAKMDGKGGL